ncbi:MAG: TetR/AcrR family transcriptional regulator [Sphingobacteriales bacterium]|nr:TetR/AcrR family transcriptional regulator [Sphingobacteriales bacterium]
MSKGEDTRQFIIEQSAPLFNIKGTEATSMSDIMEATKLSKGCLYVHFENKEVLAAAAVDYNLKMLGTKVLAGMSDAKTAKEKLFAYIDVLSDVLNPPVKGGCPLINFGMEADDTNPVIKQKVHEMIEFTQQFLSNIVNQGVKDGEFKPEWNFKEFSTIMFAMMEGGILISRVAGNNSKIKIIGKHLKQMITDQIV